jgi:hypothetical protein
MFDSGQLFVNSVDRTTDISDPSSFSWSATRGARGDCSIPLRLFADDSYSPDTGDLLEIYDPPVGQPGATRVWIGTVEDYDIDFQDNDGLRLASLKGVTLHQMFDTQPCPELVFDGASAADIFTALFGSGVYPVSVTLGTVDTGATITRNYDPKTNMGSAFGQLATDSNGYWDINPRTFPPQVNFIVDSIPMAAFTLRDANILFGSNKYRQSRSDFRDRQIIQAPPGVAGALNATFTGDGTTTEFALPSVPNQISSVSNTNSSQATGAGTFTAQPADGDTITIAGIAYTFKNIIDNSVARQVKIAGTLAITGQNLADAINLTPGTSGTGYSSPTQVNGVVTAAWNGSTVITVTAVSTGSLGNGVPLAESSATFSWAASVTTGGVTGQLAGLSFGSYAAGNFDVLWTPGSPTLTFAVPPANGINVIVVYTGVMSSFPSVSNDTAAGLGIGSQYQIMTARNATEYAQVLQQANAVLAGRSVIPGEYRFVSDNAGYFTGDGFDVDLTTPAQLVAKVNGQPWIVQDVSAEWIEGMEFTDEPYGHFRYSCHFVNTVAFTPYQQTLQRLVDNPLRSLPATDLTPPTNGGDGSVVRVIYWDRLVLSDSTVADDVMPHVTVALPLISESPLSYIVGKGLRCLAVLSVAITDDLTVRFNKLSSGSPTTTVSWTVTIPNGTPVDEVVPTDISDIEFFEGDVISGDVTASDGQTIAAAPWGIATFQIVWAA